MLVPRRVDVLYLITAWMINDGHLDLKPAGIPSVKSLPLLGLCFWGLKFTCPNWLWQLISDLSSSSFLFEIMGRAVFPRTSSRKKNNNRKMIRSMFCGVWFWNNFMLYQAHVSLYNKFCNPFQSHLDWYDIMTYIILVKLQRPHTTSLQMVV